MQKKNKILITQYGIKLPSSYSQYALPNQYCPECRQCITLNKMDNKGFVKAAFKSLDCDIWQCPKCKSIFIFGLAELWERAQEFYRDLVKVEP